MRIRSNYLLVLAMGSLGLTACENMDQDFERMNSAELVAYNRAVDLWGQVHCVSEVRNGSHIKRRYCNTLLELYNQVDTSASRVNVLSASQVQRL